MVTWSFSNTVVYPASANLLVLTREFSVMDGTMWMSLAGCPTSCISCFSSVALALVPSGRWNILVDVLPVAMCGSVIVPTLEVAPLLATADGMVPLSTPCRIASL